LTTEQDSSIVRLAAEATLTFEYEQISKPLEKIITDTSLPAEARANVINALNRPDIGAISNLMDLLDDSEKQVASQAEETLISLGIPIGEDAKARRQIIKELERKGKDEFLRDWLIRQEARMHELESELDLWQQLYLAALGKIYDSFDNDTARGKFLTEHLASSKAPVRLWALEKVSQWRVGTKSKLPAELGPVLVSLISDANKNVRLKTAKLLSLMSQLNSAEQLAKQFEVEQDDDVRIELFIALGRACHYAFSPSSGIKIPTQIRKQTLEWAGKYLLEDDPRKAQKGAEVIKKLLAQDGFSPAEVAKYLGLLAERYNRADGGLRGELLSAMAGLCAQNIDCRTQSVKLFKPLFEEALRDKTNLVRQAAAAGLISIDKARALKKLRDFVNDSSIEERIIDLASEVGGREDLFWLAEKTGTAAENEPAWQAMLKIFKRCDADVLNEWASKLDSPSTEGKLSDEQKFSLLEIAEAKANIENKLKMLKGIREKLADLCKKNGKFREAADYLGILHTSADSPEEKDAILPDLLDAYLRWPNVEMAARLVDNCLLKKDLGPNSVVVLAIDNYLTHPPVAAEPNMVLEELLAEIKTTEDRPAWAEQRKRLINRLGRAKNLDKTKEAGN